MIIIWSLSIAWGIYAVYAGVVGDEPRPRRQAPVQVIHEGTTPYRESQIEIAGEPATLRTTAPVHEPTDAYRKRRYLQISP